jgi:beta-galactosidase
MKNIIVLFSVCFFLACSPHKPVRQTIDFTGNWQFTLSDSTADYSAADVDVSDWRTIRLPHDWSIESDFSIENPATPGGGALPGGIGWYRKTFTLPRETQGKQIYIDFDGAYWCSEVWVNGSSVGFHPNGYISFRYDLTPYIHPEGENVIAVRVDNSKQPNSRWYSGSGIYREVRLVITHPVHVDLWGTYVTTPEISEKEALVQIETTVENPDNREAIRIRHTIEDAQGKKVGSAVSEETVQTLKLENPELWSIENPYLYTLITELESNGKIIDEYKTTFGIRSFRFDAAKGFFLNDKPVKINGVCNHHDLGCLGAAVNYRAIERQLEILKAMGCNGIRTSHNPPAPELLDLCDKMGFIVMDEAFDIWKMQKTPHDYASYFDEWHERDLTDMILRDRNHPSVFMWSVGNEVPEQWLKNDNAGLLLTQQLVNIVQSLDSTRPVLSACNNTSPDNPFFRPNVLDLIGFNYSLDNYDKVPQHFPGRPFIASESVSGLMSRGEYQMPSDSIRIWPDAWDKPFFQSVNHCSAYDNCHVPWGNSHEESWKYIRKADFVSGQYIWTGFDYLGEPTPFGWPARSSYFGIIDLAGFPKDIYYMYQSEWTDKTVLHVFPHWNWEPGQITDIWAYYNQADEVELFLNGKSLGIKKKENDELHVCWRIPFEPGTLKAISRKDGKEVLSKELKTAGEPVSIRLTADREVIQATGKDLAFITAEVLDKDGNVVPTANPLLQFTAEGEGDIAGTDNGDPTNPNSLKKPERNLFNGKCLVVVQGRNKKGTIQLTASSVKLKSETLLIRVQ